MHIAGADEFKRRQRYSGTTRYIHSTTYSYVLAVLASPIYVGLQRRSIRVDVRNFTKLIRKLLSIILPLFLSFSLPHSVIWYRQSKHIISANIYAKSELSLTFIITYVSIAFRIVVEVNGITHRGDVENYYCWSWAEPFHPAK